MLDGINEMLLKILITGEPGVGKTQLIDSFLGSLELEKNKTEKPMMMIQGVSVTFQIEEIGINDFFNQKVENCQHDILLLTFNIVNPQSLELASIKCSALSRLLGPSVPLLLIGCKSDLVTNHSVLSKLSAQGVTPVSRLKALSIAQKLGASLYIETETVFKKTSSTAAFEAAALTVLGHFQEQPKTIKDRITSPPRDQSPYEFWNTVTNKLLKSLQYK